MKCSICGENIKPDLSPNGEVIWAEGNNAQPINDGRCCNDCNMIVVKRRINDSFKENKSA